MRIDLAAASRIVPLTALMLGACVPQSAYDKQAVELQQARAEISKMQQEQKWVVAGARLSKSASY